MAGELGSRTIATACVRAATARGFMAAILRRGDPDRGVVYLKTLARDGASTLFIQTRDAVGRPAWRQAIGPEPRPEAEVDERLRREADVDPDLWAVEVMDDRHGHPLEPDLI